ncbi:MAG: HAMP domain-containing sensor histidine kinase [Egibacteraceae bacterium]
MRKRLLTSTIVAVVVAILLLGLPSAYAVRYLLEQQALDALQGEARAVAALIARPDLRVYVRPPPGLRLVVIDLGSRRAVFDTGGPPEIPPWLEGSQAALDERVGRGAGGDVLAVSVPVVGAPLILHVVRDDDALVANTRRAWAAIAALALLALAMAAVLARAQGERLAAPVEALAGAARRLGDGDFTARAPYSGLPEADDVARALQMTAERLGATLERSRSFSADASHQLRTPLTALRLDLEALESAGADPELIGAAIREADRLEATIVELLSLADTPSGLTSRFCDIGALASARLDAWQSLARAAGRKVVLDASPVPPVQARPGAIGQCLQVLLDNALEHGAGTIAVSVRAVAAGGGLGLTGEGPDTKWVRLCVADEGPGIPPERREGLLSGRADAASGRGLPLARQLVEAEGGRLTLERAAPGAMLCLLVPVVS